MNQAQFHTTNTLLDIQVNPDGRGLITGAGNVLLCTSNFGENWTGTGSADPDLTALSYAGGHFYYANRAGAVFRESSPGLCIGDVMTIASSALNGLIDLQMFNALEGYVLSLGRIHFSNNGWTSSTPVSNINCPSDASSMWFLNPELGFTGTSSGSIYRISLESGTFICEIVSSGSQAIRAIHFYDTLNGFAVGDDSRFLLTQNGGLSWVARELPFNDDLVAVFARSADDVHCAANQIYRSGDAGLSWYQQIKPAGMTRIEALWFDNVNRGWAVGLNGKIAFTNNAGAEGLPLGESSIHQATESWTMQPNPVGQDLMLSSTLPFERNFVLYQSQGRAVLEGSFSQQISLDLSELPPGMYWMQVPGYGTKSLIKAD